MNSAQRLHLAVVDALFTERAAARNASDELHCAGFGDNQVGMVVREGSVWKVTGMGRMELFCALFYIQG